MLPFLLIFNKILALINIISTAQPATKLCWRNGYRVRLRIERFQVRVLGRAIFCSDSQRKFYVELLINFLLIENVSSRTVSILQDKGKE
jgi:hypothetical protein